MDEGTEVGQVTGREMAAMEVCRQLWSRRCTAGSGLTTCTSELDPTGMGAGGMK